MLVGGIVQYGMIFATKHALIQVGRDVGRWAATQPCQPMDADGNDQPVTQADIIAQESRLMGYTGGDWDSTNFDPYPDNSLPFPDNDPLPADPPRTQGVEVVWSYAAAPCEPADNTTVSWVTVRLTHRAPVVLPGFPFLPGLGTCDSDGCYFVVTTTATFRVEPVVTP
jgi:hypothetical protein